MLRRKKLIATVLLAAFVLTFGAVATASADNDETYIVDTQPIESTPIDDTVPDVTYAPTEPSYTDPSEPFDEPVTDPVPDGGMITTTPTQSNPYSDNTPAPNGVFGISDIDSENKEWQELKYEELKKNAGSSGSFASIQKDDSKGNKISYISLIIGIICILCAVGGVIFIILFKPKALVTETNDKARHTRARYAERKPATERARRSNDDYNDGY